MNGPTGSISGFRSKYISIIVEVKNGRIIIKSGGNTYEIEPGKPAVYILPRELKNVEAQWDKTLGKYIVLSRIIAKRAVFVEPVLVDDNSLPSDSNLVIRYSGTSARRFVELLHRVLSRYYKGSKVVRLPLGNKDVFRLAVALARMASLQPISDVV